MPQPGSRRCSGTRPRHRSGDSAGPSTQPPGQKCRSRCRPTDALPFGAIGYQRLEGATAATGRDLGRFMATLHQLTSSENRRISHWWEQFLSDRVMREYRPTVRPGDLLVRQPADPVRRLDHRRAGPILNPVP